MTKLCIVCKKEPVIYSGRGQPPKYCDECRKKVKRLRDKQDKFKKRTLTIKEYIFISIFIRKLKPSVIIDIGTFLGASGYILGTSSANLEYLYALEHHEGPTYGGPYKGTTTDDYGKYLPNYAIFKTYGYENTFPI